MGSFKVFVLLFLCVSFVFAEKEIGEESRELGRELIEQGRTFVHHAMKRMAIILPAVFFKLGIAFSLLLLVTIVSVNNGFIGFMLLVVGLSSVLARLQEARTPPTYPAVPYTRSAVHYTYPAHHHYALDRSDVGVETASPSSSAYYPYTGIVYGKYS